MAGTFTQLLYHVVFATKYRANLITTELQPRLYEYLGGVIRSERVKLFPPPFQGGELLGDRPYPRVALRSTRGYKPVPLRGKETGGWSI